MYDLAIVGGGPAGLAAALNARRRNKMAVIIGKEDYSSKLMQSRMIDNYLGLPEITGSKLARKLKDHALTEGAEYLKDEVQSISADGSEFTLMGRAQLVQAKTVVLATGIVLGTEINGEVDWIGRGVSYCATCDGMFFKDKKVALIGYIPEAVAEANFLAEICALVYFLPLFKGMEQLDGRITVIDGKPLEISGRQRLEVLRTSTGEIAVDGVFIERSGRPVEQLLTGLATTDGFIDVGLDQNTNIPGVFAAGDCTGRPWQIARAIGQGQVAALSAVKYLDIRGEK
jgi:thioredoxin reductase (NADPH)